MKTLEEKSFPRGGKKPIVGKQREGERTFPRGVLPDFKKRKNSSVFKVRHKEVPKKQEHSESDESDIDYVDILEEDVAEELGLKKKRSSKPKTFIRIITNKTVSEGLVLLGCIGEINEFELKINLPGRMLAYVPISEISDPYNTALQKVLKGQPGEPGKLAEMFNVGQFVIVKVEKIERFENSRNKFTVTLNPSKIYSDWTFKAMKKGLVLSAAVKSVEDHGYVMDFGIPDVRAFLKKQNAIEYEKEWNKGQQLAVGQVVQCLVIKSNVCENYCIVELTLDPAKIREATLDDVALSSIIPGMRFNIEVTEVTNMGLAVKFAEDMTGYVHADHLKNPYTNLDNIRVHQELSGRVLYIEPYTKHVYFSLRKSICEYKTVAPSLQRGCIISEAKVVAVRSGAMYLKLKDQEHLYGIVTLRHVDKKIEAGSEVALDKKLSKAYPLGSRHKCRLLGYDYMLQVFTCTLEKTLLKQPYLHPEECKLGDVVECVVQKAAPRGIRVSIGTVQGFVDPLHFADTPVAHPEKVFPVNKKVKAKILKVSKSAVEVTLRSSLINSSNPLLHNYEDAEENEEYDGVVVELKSGGCLVKFYGNVTGWLKRSDYFMGMPPEIGQVIKCKVYYSDPDEQKIFLRLAQDALKPIKKECSLKVGHFYNVTVTDTMVDGLVVSAEEDPLKGIIPAQQLSDCKQLGFLLCQTYKRGDKLRACCLSVQDNVIFSISPTFMDFFQSRAGKDLASLGAAVVTKYMAIPALVMQITHEILVVDVPVNGMCPVFVLKRNVLDGLVDDFSSLGLEIYQTLVIKIVQFVPNSNALAASKLSSVWNGGVEMGVKLLQNFVDDVEKLTRHFELCGQPLTDLQLGSEVNGVVISCSDLGALLRLSNGLDAVVPTKHYEEGEVCTGMRVVGTVMFVDVLNNCVEVTLREDMKQLISNAATNSLKSSDIGRELNGDVLLIKPNLMLVCLHDEEESYLAFAPTQRHINDFKQNPVMNIHDRYVIKVVKGANVICVPEKMDITKEKIKEKARKEAEEKKMENKKAQTLKSFSSQKISNKNGEFSYGKDVDPQNVSCEAYTCENKPKKIKKRKNNSNVLPNENIEENYHEADGSSKKKNSLGEGVKSAKKVVTATKKKRKALTSLEAEKSSTDISNSALKKENAGNSKKKRNNILNASEDASTVNVSNKSIKVTKKKKNSLKVANDESISDNNDSLLKNQKYSNVEDLTIIKKKNKAKKRKSSCDLSNSSKILKTEDRQQKSCLDVDSGFVWDAKPEHLQALTKGCESDQSSSEDEKEDESLNKKKKKKRLSAAEKKAQMREKEERLRQVEMRLMDSEKNPQSADDFERLIVSTPNNSKNWIKYMAFHLQGTEIEKAKAVGQRALETIVFREEQEKLNVWMALLNLENLYGTKESFDKTLQNAIQYNDDFKVYMQVIQMYADSGKIEELDSLVKMVSKKYKSRKDMWLRVGGVYMKLGHFDKARQMMQRALLALEKPFHVELISRYALMENDNGQSERAETLMENILTSYPKRVDVWNLYVDMLVKSKKVDLARQVLERSVVQKLPLNKLRSLYKRFLKFEQDHGTPQGEERVHAMAKEHVQKSMQSVE